MGDVHTILHEELWARARIRVHQGRSQVWNRGGSRPTGADALTRAQEVRPGKVISICRWIIRVLRVLGAPIGTLEYVMRQLKAKSKERAVLLDRIPAVAVVQAALAFAPLPWFDPCELQFEDGQTAAGAAVCEERRRERLAVFATGDWHRRRGR